MGQTDFIMAIVIIIGVISFTLFFISSNFSTQLEQVNVLELKQSASVLENKIYNLATGDMKLSKVSFENLIDSAHTETVSLSFTGEIGEMELYDNDMDLIASGNPLTFSLTVGQEIEYFDAIYLGSVTDVDYNSAPNITARVLEEQDYKVLSEELCNLIDYNETRKEFNHNFKIKLGNCEISLHGANPPKTTVVAKKVPVIIKSDQIRKDFLNIMVW